MEDRIEVPRDWFPEWAAQSSPAWFLGVHMYDLIRWITRSDALWVSATGMKKKLADLGIDTYDSIQAKIVLKTGASFTVDTSWILPEVHEAIVNQGIRVVGSEGMLEVDTQDRGARGCYAAPPGSARMQTPNLGFFQENRERKGLPRFSGYGIESIQDFALNVAHLVDGGSLKDLAGAYAGGKDGLEATKIAVAVHESASAAGAVVCIPESPEY
jgi:predicted dehydrogenase